jgi:hypothetical protein
MHKTSCSVIGICARVIDHFWDKAAISGGVVVRLLTAAADIRSCTRATPSNGEGQRTTSAYIFGAICPDEGKGASLMLPRCITEGRHSTSQRYRPPSRRGARRADP